MRDASMTCPFLQRVDGAARELGDLARGVRRREALREPLHVGDGDGRPDARERDRASVGTLLPFGIASRVPPR